MKTIITLVAAVCLAAASASAHEFFVIPEEVREFRTGETVKIQALSTHYFFVGEELEPAEVNQVRVRQGGQTGPALPLAANRDRLFYETSFVFGSGPAIVEGNRTGGFYCIFTDGGYADGTRAEVAADPANAGKTVATARYFAKYSKLYLNPAANDTAFATPLGTEIEIVPITNPAQIRSGRDAKFRVLYRGQPLANADVQATYDTFNYRSSNAWALSAKTDAKGEVTLRISSQGLWAVRCSDTRRSARPGTDEDNVTAIVLFGVAR